nr:hypothetical protein [Kibdelosporangium sp. MJ126-NF4]
MHRPLDQQGQYRRPDVASAAPMATPAAPAETAPAAPVALEAEPGWERAAPRPSTVSTFVPSAAAEHLGFV